MKTIPDLTKKHCTPSGKSSNVLTASQLKQYLAEAPHWKMAADRKRIRRKWSWGIGDIHDLILNVPDPPQMIVHERQQFPRGLCVSLFNRAQYLRHLAHSLQVYQLARRSAIICRESPAVLASGGDSSSSNATFGVIRQIIFALEMARVVAHEPAPLFLRDRIDAHLEALGQRDLVPNGFVAEVTRIL